MEGVELFLELVRGVSLVLVAFWPITLGLAAAWACAFALTKPAEGGGRRRVLALGCLPPLAFPVAILACGAAFASPPTGAGSEARSVAGQAVVVALLLVQVPLAGVAAWRWGERWPAVVASWACGGYLSLLAGFISSMAVTGVWL